MNDLINELRAQNEALTVLVDAFKTELNKCVVNGVPVLRVSENLKSLVAQSNTESINAYLAGVKTTTISDFCAALSSTLMQIPVPEYGRVHNEAMRDTYLNVLNKFVVAINKDAKQ